MMNTVKISDLPEITSVSSTTNILVSDKSTGISSRITKANLVSDVVSNLNSEASSRAAADNELQTSIGNEAVARENFDNILLSEISLISESLSAESQARAAAYNTLQKNIATEVGAREIADNVILGELAVVVQNLSNIEETLTAADAALRANITAEAYARTAADNTLQQNITSEAGARALADIALQEQIDSISDLNGTNYVMVYGTGTPAENGVELSSAYANAIVLGPTAGNVVTLLIAPGKYNNNFTCDVPYINISSLTGERDVIFTNNFTIVSPDPSYHVSNINITGIEVLGKFDTKQCIGCTFTKCKSITTGQDQGGSFDTDCLSPNGSFALSCHNTYIECIAGYECFAVHHCTNTERATSKYIRCESTGSDSFIPADYENSFSECYFESCKGGAYNGSINSAGCTYLYCNFSLGTPHIISTNATAVACFIGGVIINQQ